MAAKGDKGIATRKKEFREMRRKEHAQENL
jgi:hypothetical protein